MFLFFTLAYDTPLTRMFNLYTRRIRPYAVTVPPPFDARSRISTVPSTLFFVHTALKKNIGKLGVVVCIKSTKFNQQIKDFGHKLAMHIAASNPLTIEVSQIDKKMLKKENEIIGEELKNSGKSENIIEKNFKGKVRKI